MWSGLGGGVEDPHDFSRNVEMTAGVKVDLQCTNEASFQLTWNANEGAFVILCDINIQESSAEHKLAHY